MPYEPPKYPAAIPTAGDLPDRADDVDWLYAARYNELKKELRAALIELGTDPSGGSATVKDRLALLALKANVLELDNVDAFTPDADYEPATKKYVDDAAVAGFTDRGDPANYDWTKETLSIDAAWHELDMSAIVPAGAKAVLLKVMLLDDVVNSWIVIRKNGNIRERTAVKKSTQVANVWVEEFSPIPCDTDRKLEYIIENVTWIELNITVVGWWM